jgi:transposase
MGEQPVEASSELLIGLFGKGIQVPKRKAAKKEKLFLRSVLSQWYCVKAIRLRFGRVGCFVPQMRVNRVHQILGGQYKTIYRLCARYEKDRGLLFRKDNMPKFKKLEPIKAHLTSKECLNAWKTKSLQQRVALIKQDFGISISYALLWNFYKANKVKRLKPGYVYKRKATAAETQKQQMAFVKKIGSLLAAPIPSCGQGQSSELQKENMQGPELQQGLIRVPELH